MQTAKDTVLCRSVLYMPGANARALEKARTLKADALIFDLEDAVAPDAKAAARANVADALAGGGYAPRYCVVRVNALESALESAWATDDIKAVIGCGADALLAPKIACARDVYNVHKFIIDAATSANVAPPALWIMVETPRALLNIAEIAGACADTALSAFVLGTNDLAKELGANFATGRAPLLTGLSLALLAARAHGLLAIDGVFNDIADADGFEAEAMQGRDMGYDGKTLIHPNQIETANAVFAPEADAVAQARAVVAAFDEPANQGKGVLKIDGRMVELLHRDMAVQLIARADAIAERDA